MIYWSQYYADRKVPSVSDLILTISSVLEKIYKKRNPLARALLFPAIVDTSRFGNGDKLRFRKKMNLGERPVIAFTGSFVHTEGLQLFLEVMARIIKIRPECMVLIAGGSLVPGSDDADQLIKFYRLDSNARHLGMVSENDVIDLQAGSDILVMPKLDDPINHAGLSTKLAEYLASGRAVIASNVGDIGKYLINGQDALVIPPGDMDALEKALLRLLADSELRCKLGSSARQVALRYFDLQTNVALLTDALISKS
jgi:glycosyltransferase involved in cell wall biosynthesis